MRILRDAIEGDTCIADELVEDCPTCHRRGAVLIPVPTDLRIAEPPLPKCIDDGFRPVYEALCPSCNGRGFIWRPQP